jgi:trehalose synthase-fused probable maltokinase
MSPERLPGPIDERTLIDFVEGRRWFGAKAEEVVHAKLLDVAVLRSQPPVFAIAIAEIRFAPGTHQLYQVLLGYRPAEEGWSEEVVGQVDGETVYEALADPALSRELVHLMRSKAEIAADEGTISFGAVDLAGFGTDLYEPRSIGVEQSNTSVVFGDELILKAYRRLEPGINPELEVLRFLTEREFPNIAALVGWYGYSGPLITATLGVLQRFVPDADGGWELALDELRSDPERFLGRVRRLGEVTGDLHAALASDPSEPDFAPEEPSAEALGLLTATVDEEIESIFLELPEGVEALEPIMGRGEEVRDRLRLFTHVGSSGKVIRHHGDYHLGQVLWSEGDWVVIDFEGEPARSLPERRQKRSPLRDVAGMLRSFAYAASASEILNGVRAPDGWEERARELFLEGYFEHVDSSLVPPGKEARERMIAVFELEKAVYELRYELNNRPGWLGIPVAGVLRILESPL